MPTFRDSEIPRFRDAGRRTAAFARCILVCSHSLDTRKRSADRNIAISEIAISEYWDARGSLVWSHSLDARQDGGFHFGLRKSMVLSLLDCCCPFSVHVGHFGRHNLEVKH